MLDRLAALGGTLYPPLAIVGLSLASPALPVDFTAPPEVIAAHAAAHTPTTLTWVGLGLESLGLAALAMFAIRLAVHLTGWVATAAAAFGVAAVMVKVASFAPVLVAVQAQDLGAESLALLYRLNDMAVPVSDGLLATFVVLAGAAILGSGALRPWVGWGAVTSGAASLVDIAGGPGLLALLVLVWLMAAGVVLLRALGRVSIPVEPALA